ncbi:phage tail sheath protein [Azohydromonas lata]|uniref:Phage tail sheath protein n=1 Tax=Azohydromonas lata TaxID=45677 RepID=A0ABU5ID05_9BURK|nr:phage tail sheath protein [Azohydromonas lata]MDZ5456992.1 phage tail sheath protein [Azohydromonas lata]
MPITSYHHGVRIVETTDGKRPIRDISTAVIGMVVTASDADATTFPLDTPVLLTDVYAAMAKSGDLGTLSPSLEAIAAQTRPLTIVVRVAEGANAAETTSNVVGTVTPAGKKTGLKALLTAEAVTGLVPKILGVPGLDTQAVTTEMVAIAQKLRAMAYAFAHGADTVSEAITYRDEFAARELMLLWPDFKRWDTDTSASVLAPSTAYALGLRAKIDKEQGWHKTLSNVAVNGVTGISADVSWDLQDPATDAGTLNAGEVTTLVRRDGYRFWGSRTCSDDPLYAFESATRTGQVLADMIADGHMWAIDKPLRPGLIKDIIDGVNDKIRSLVTAGRLMGGRCWWEESANPASQLAQGGAEIKYDFTAVAPLENLQFVQQITDSYYADFAKGIRA